MNRVGNITLAQHSLLNPCSWFYKCLCLVVFLGILSIARTRKFCGVKGWFWDWTVNLQHFCFSGLYFCFLSITKCLPAGYFQKEAQREHSWVSDFWSQCLQRNETMELRTREGRVKEKEVYDCRRDDNVSLLRLLCGWKWALVGLVVAWSCRGTSGLGIEKTAEVKVTTGDVEKGAGRVAAYGPPG